MSLPHRPVPFVSTRPDRVKGGGRPSFARPHCHTSKQKTKKMSRDLSLAETWREHSKTLEGARDAAECFRSMSDGKLILCNCELTSLPAELAQVEGLVSLNCNYNSLQFLPAWLGSCQALEELYCELNLLETLPPELGECENLRWIDCGYNNLTSLPAELGNCQKLKFLQAHYNNLTTLPISLGQCELLEDLDWRSDWPAAIPQMRDDPIPYLREQWASRTPTKSANKK